MSDSKLVGIMRPFLKGKHDTVWQTEILLRWKGMLCVGDEDCIVFGCDIVGQVLEVIWFDPGDGQISDAGSPGVRPNSLYRIPNMLCPGPIVGKERRIPFRPLYQCSEELHVFVIFFHSR